MNPKKISVFTWTCFRRRTLITHFESATTGYAAGDVLFLGFRKPNPRSFSKFPQVTVVALAAFGLLLKPTQNLSAQDWLGSDAPAGNWYSVAASVNGKTMVAAAGLDSIYISTDSGASWITTGLPPAGWEGVAISADGKKMVAVATGYCPACSASFGGIYLSKDSGATWTTNQTGSTDWRTVCSSADGTKLAAGTPDAIYVSTNSGFTWTKTSASFGHYLASSADGSILLAGACCGYPLLLSRDSGATWGATIVPGASWNSVAASADGTRLIAGSGTCILDPSGGTSCKGAIYISTNSGTSWTETIAPTNMSWGKVASSADGTRLVAAAGFAGSLATPIYISRNSGTAWEQTSAPSEIWAALASSSDGNILVAGVSYGGLLTWQALPTSEVIPPVLDITFSGQKVILSWTIPSKDFRLQQTTDLQKPDWTNVAAAQVFNFSNLRYEVNLTLAAGPTYFRLASE